MSLWLTNELKSLSKVLGQFLGPCVGDCYSIVHKLLLLLVVVGALGGHIENVPHSKLLQYLQGRSNREYEDVLCNASIIAQRPC